MSPSLSQSNCPAKDDDNKKSLTLPSSPKSGKKFKVERSRKYLLFPNGSSERSDSKPQDVNKHENGVTAESGELVTFEDEGLTLRQQFSEEDSSIVE